MAIVDNVNLIDYNPMFVTPPATRQSKYTVTADEWNALWQLSIMQGNNTSATMDALLDKLTGELWAPNGASFIKNPELVGGSGTTVSSQLAWLKAYSDTINTLAGTANVTANSASAKADTNLITAKTYTDTKLAELGDAIEFIPSIKKFTYDLQATGEGQVKFNIPDVNFNSTKDIVSVFQNGWHIIDTDYTITNRVGSTLGFITLSEGVKVGTYVTIELIRIFITVA